MAQCDDQGGCANVQPAFWHSNDYGVNWDSIPVVSSKRPSIMALLSIAIDLVEMQKATTPGIAYMARCSNCGSWAMVADGTIVSSSTMDVLPPISYPWKREITRAEAIGLVASHIVSEALAEEREASENAPKN